MEIKSSMTPESLVTHYPLLYICQHPEYIIFCKKLFYLFLRSHTLLTLFFIILIKIPKRSFLEKMFISAYESQVSSSGSGAVSAKVPLCGTPGRSKVRTRAEFELRWCILFWEPPFHDMSPWPKHLLALCLNHHSRVISILLPSVINMTILQ